MAPQFAPREFREFSSAPTPRTSSSLLPLRELPASAIFLLQPRSAGLLLLAHSGCVLCTDFQRVLIALQIDFFAFGIDLVLSVLPIPLGDCRVLVHIFDDLTPANSCVGSAEGHLSLLSGVGNTTQFCSTAVVIN